MRASICLLCAVLTGCAGASTAVRVGSGAGTADGAGTTTTTATLGVYIGSGSAASALLGAGLVAGAIYDAQGDGEDADAARRAPPLDPHRRVLRQDCTRPIKDPSANLMCK